MEITHTQFLDACDIVKEYQKQINDKVKYLNRTSAIKLFPNEMHFTWDTYFPTMSIKLWSLLRSNFDYTSLCNIDKKTFLTTKGCGAKSWSEFEELIKI